MNTYHDNQLTTVKKILKANEEELNKRTSEATVADFNVYFAVGAQLLAKDNLDQVNIDYAKTMDVNHQGVLNSTQANNLLTSSQQADQNVTTLVNNAATVAKSVQVAANAILKLAGSIGSVNNIVHASEYDNDIYNLTQRTNYVMNVTAYQAELASQYAMESTADASQIISKQTLAEATATKAAFDSMLVLTQAELSTLTQTRNADTDKLIAANTALHLNEGILSVAKRERGAAKTSYKISKHDLNYYLRVRVKTMSAIEVSFRPFIPPFCEQKTKSNASSLANRALVQRMLGYDNQAYPCYLAIAKADTKDSLNYGIVETRFQENQSERFVRVEPADQKTADGKWVDLWNPIELYAPPYSTKPAPDPNAPPKRYLAQDLDGNPLMPGVTYVAIIYQVIDPTYKAQVSNYLDRITAPSEEFTLATGLSQVELMTGDGEHKNKKLMFEPLQAQPTTDLEYRLILVQIPNNDNPDVPDDVKTWFDLEIAKQVARVNYLRIPGDNNSNQLEFTITDTTLDNFGNLLAKGKRYAAMILAIVPEDRTQASFYTPSLSNLEMILTIDFFPEDVACEKRTLVITTENIKDIGTDPPIDPPVIPDGQVEPAAGTGAAPGQTEAAIGADAAPDQTETAIGTGATPNQTETAIGAGAALGQTETTIGTEAAPDQTETAIGAEAAPDQTETAIGAGAGHDQAAENNQTIQS